jgi:hypothetical protein
MYLQNKYTRWYNTIIQRAQTRNLPPEMYVERHHIIPRSLGGTNDSDNLVVLTAREHFVCHLLLTKMTEGTTRNKMISAVFYLTGRGKAKKRNNVIKTSHLYQQLKKEFSEYNSKMHKGSKRPPRSLQTKQRLSSSKTGKLNPNFKGCLITPWGKFESSRLAAKHCPIYITANFILRLCTQNNHKPITLLSVCRSKAYLNEQHIGLTPADIGFSFQT